MFGTNGLIHVLAQNMNVIITPLLVGFKVYSLILLPASFSHAGAQEQLKYSSVRKMEHLTSKNLHGRRCRERHITADVPKKNPVLALKYIYIYIYFGNSATAGDATTSTNEGSEEKKSEIRVWSERLCFQQQLLIRGGKTEGFLLESLFSFVHM